MKARKEVEVVVEGLVDDHLEEKVWIKGRVKDLIPIKIKKETINISLMRKIMETEEAEKYLDKDQEEEVLEEPSFNVDNKGIWIMSYLKIKEEKKKD